ncbi:hypothetical protein BLOT_007255 [Blomia tropicalis]|nr:hypothetical protein BLOT_007255 [Blomia tropicalis]
MWPLKAHYCLWFGAHSGVLPYLAVFLRTHLNASATTVGTLYCVLPFVVSIVKPIACSAADHYGKHSQALLISQILTFFGYGLLAAIPFILEYIPLHILLYGFCFLALLANTSMGVGISLTDFLVINEVKLVNQHGGNTNYGAVRIWGTIGFGIFGILVGIINENSPSLPYLIPGLFIFIATEILDIICIYRFYHLKQTKLPADSITNDHDNVDYHTPNGQYSDSLEMDSEPYGPTVTTQYNAQSLSLWNRIRIGVKQAASTSIDTLFQILRIYYRYPSLIQYTLIVFCFGILTAFHWSFFFWFIQDIRGQDSLLMGLCIFVNSFLGEIPVFLVAYRIIQWVGPIFSLCISLLAFALRYLCYGYLLKKEYGKYWDVLLIETLQGLTFSLFYTVMTHIAQMYADKCEKIFAINEIPSSSLESNSNDRVASLRNLASSRESSIDDEAEGEFESNMSGQSKMNSLRSKSRIPTSKKIVKPSALMQGLLSACYEGLGLGVGSLLGGFLIEYFDVGSIWRIAGFFSLALVALNVVIEAIKFVYKKRRNQPLI